MLYSGGALLATRGGGGMSGMFITAKILILDDMPKFNLCTPVSLAKAARNNWWSPA